MVETNPWNPHVIFQECDLPPWNSVALSTWHGQLVGTLFG